MTLEVIGAGFGRTGTMSLKLALEQLGVGPCYHMVEVLGDQATRVPQWNAAAAGEADYPKIFAGYASAVDWPVAAFWREVSEVFPNAKVILSTRGVDSWYASFSETILAVLTAPDRWPEPARPWLEMVSKVVIERSLGGRTDRDGVIAAFEAHEAAVKASVPPERLLVFSAKDGWEPLCAFLGKPVPAGPFPRTNTKEEFFEHMKAGASG